MMIAAVVFVFLPGTHHARAEPEHAAPLAGAPIFTSADLRNHHRDVSGNHRHLGNAHAAPTAAADAHATRASLDRYRAGVFRAP